MSLKPDHDKCPLWIGNDCVIFLEAYSPQYKVASDFLVAIAEPLSRPSFIHEYRLTKYSLYAAASVGLTDKDIISKLRDFAKNYQSISIDGQGRAQYEIPEEVVEFIKMHSSSYGKAKIVLKNNQYFIEAVDKPTMDKLTSFECIKQGISDFILEEQFAVEEAKRNQFKYTEEGFELLMAEKQA